MRDTAHRAVAVVGVGSILPGAPDTRAFWDNLKAGRYSIGDVDPARWDPALYYHPDPKTPDATYSKIGGWVREWEWDPIGWRLPVPPKVADAMDEAQRWAINCTRAALADYGYPDRKLDGDRTAVILGNAMAGEKHYMTALRVSFPEFARELEHTDSFATLPREVRDDIIAQTRNRMRQWIPDITEDSMPGELANCIAGRIANLFDFHGPNYVVDAACASAMAAMSAACEGLEENDFDAVITGGIDRNMGASTYVKFCKIGALSATGTRPYADGADGFVMGEGAGLFVLKRLDDAERDGDRIYAVLRGMGGSSDGRGKGITAPNPVGQKLAIQRGWENAGLSPATASYIEGHGTSTRVGDRVECESLSEVLAAAGAAPDSVWLGSVKSNIGHLKGAAGAAGMLKTVLALHDKVLPPSINCEVRNPNIDFEHSPCKVNTELRDWDKPACGVRRVGVSAFGFGGTNFHAVLEEHIPGKLTGNGGRYVSVPETLQSSTPSVGLSQAKAPVGGAAVLGGKDNHELAARLRDLIKFTQANRLPQAEAPLAGDLEAPVRIALDFDNAADLAKKAGIALKALERNDAGFWKALGAQGIFRGTGEKQKIAFLYPGQGSQYLNMLKGLRDSQPAVREIFDQADRVMKPHLDGRTLSELLYVDESDEATAQQANHTLRQTEITQPVVLTVDTALSKLLAGYGIGPDMVMGHSLGEYGALVAGGAMDFADALEAVSARGREMVSVSMEDNGKMAAVFAPLDDVQRLLAKIDGYVVIANINSTEQSVIGGASPAIDRAVELCTAAGIQIVPLPVSHAFHTKIVAPASEPLRNVLARMNLRAPRLPVISNVTGGFYPQANGAVESMLDLLARQIASPVQFIKGLDTLYTSGARVYVEVGPKKALKGFVDSALGDKPDIVSLFTNHPKVGEARSFNQALCGLYAAGHGQGRAAPRPEVVPTARPAVAQPVMQQPLAAAANQQAELTQMFRDYMERGLQMIAGHTALAGNNVPIVISGAALGLPGTPSVFDDDNIGRILHGDQFIDVIPYRFRQKMAQKHITRLVKRDAGGPTFESIDDTSDVVKLAGRAGKFDVAQEFGVKPERAEAFDSTTAMAIAVGLDALRDAGIPLTLAYKTTTTGSQLPDRWRLPDALRDDTGIIFASAFPGIDAFAEDLDKFYTERGHREQLQALDSLREWLVHHGNGGGAAVDELDRRLAELKSLTARTEFEFDRKFLFRILAMGHSQFAEEIGARGPNTQVNGACASTTQAVSLAEDWIRAGRCRRVIVISADNVTSDHLLEWIGAGFLASGAAATDEKVEDAATPFDRRRHGMIAGMGAAALVIETASAVRERGLQPIGEVLGAVTANSAFHGTRLDVNHIAQVMEQLVSGAERRHGIRREDIAAQTMFVSHETYTPARGGSAAAEVHALRAVFGDKADQIVVSNTKGFTGHAMGAGIEDVVAIKALETGIVPPVPNYKEVDPELGALNLSIGGSYPVQYALRLAAGFGSQIAMTLMRWMPPPDGRRRNADQLGYGYRIADADVRARWLAGLSGYDHVEEEIATRRLRIKDQGPPTRATQTPQANAALAGPEVATAATQPAAMPEAAITLPMQPVATTAPKAATHTVSQTEHSSRAAPQVPTVPTTPAADALEAQVMAVVAEATGYPAEMLEPDLDLEADLGIDTVKQAEVFATIRARYDIPRDENLQLREFPTLAHVVQFVRERATDLPVVDAAPAAVPATTATNAAPPAATAPAGNDGVEETVIALVADKTGYPADMLEMDLDLEADLGVDTVKQAEVFAAIREAYDIPRDENLQLREFPTLAHVVQFVRDRTPNLPGVAAAPAAVSAVTKASVAPAAAAPATGNDGVEETVIALVADKTGYPADMLEMDLDLEADLGVDTVKQAEVFAAIREAYNIPRDENLQLREFPTLKHVVQFVRDRAPGFSAHTPAAPAEPVAVPAATDADAAITARILAIVADKTGYPADMLEMDLDLEADLGIDTVKQAEIFAAMRAAYDIPRDENLQLKDFPTLRDALRFVKERMPAQAPAKTATVAGPAAASVQQVDVMTGDMEAADSIARRVPTAFWRPSVDLCKATAVSLADGARVIVSPGQSGVGRALIERLHKRGVETLVIDGAPDYDTLESQLDAWLADGEVSGVYWLNALDGHAPINTMDFETWSHWLRANVKSLAVTMRKLYESYADPGRFLIAATRLGGKHGYDEGGARNPMGGAVSGFVKAFKRERANTLCKAVDFEVSRKTAALADRLIDETLRDPGVVEVGIAGGQRWNIGFAEQPADQLPAGIELDADSVFVVTGAAGSIVSAIIADLADASHGTFHLLDLTPEPDRNDPDIAKFSTDRDGLKRDIFERLKAGGERATPAMVEKELARLERAQSALAAITAVERAGGAAHYHAVDMTDVAAVEAVIEKVFQSSGKIDVLVHAAGIEISHFLANKPQREFDLVLDIKCNGWYGLMHGIGNRPLGAAVVFSSVAGRFGNAGQTDYSAANDLLCKGVSGFAGTRPDTRGIAIDWTAWGGIGMATRGSIPVMMEAAGIDMLPPQAGIPVVRRELTRGCGNTEVVVAGRLGVLTEEWDETGGLQIDAVPEQSFGPMTGRVVGMGVNGLTVETELDPVAQPFLYDHAIDGVPVLPGVMGLEAFAELSKLLLPDWQVESIDNISFMAPFKFYRSEPRKLLLTAQFQAANGGMYAHCSLIGERRIKTQADPVKTVHFTATVHMSREGPQHVSGARPAPTAGHAIGADAVYNVYFHGPAYRVLDSAWGDGHGVVVGRMASDLPANHSPAGLPTQIAPRAIELCFQTAGMYELGEAGILGLPWQIGSVAKLREFEDKRPLYSIVRHTEGGAGYDADVVDDDGAVYIRLQNYRTTELPGAADADRIEPIRAALHSD